MSGRVIYRIRPVKIGATCRGCQWSLPYLLSVTDKKWTANQTRARVAARRHADTARHTVDIVRITNQRVEPT